ncbi:MAG: lipase family protein, partial [Gammaproteobacteria bacterium]|nr:lipase family protein [Gammaproteobacteria bacterium]
NVVVLRGTERPFEWLMDLVAIQFPIPASWFEHKKLELTKVHAGVLISYLLMVKQIITAAKAFDHEKPAYVTGYSLGSGLALLAALTVDLRTHRGGGRAGMVQMYNYPGPRIGDPVFIDACNHVLPYSYRIVNLSDVVPTLAPVQIGGYTYRRVVVSVADWRRRGATTRWQIIICRRLSPESKLPVKDPIRIRDVRS